MERTYTMRMRISFSLLLIFRMMLSSPILEARAWGPGTISSLERERGTTEQGRPFFFSEEEQDESIQCIRTDRRKVQFYKKKYTPINSNPNTFYKRKKLTTPQSSVTQRHSPKDNNANDKISDVIHSWNSISFYLCRLVIDLELFELVDKYLADCLVHHLSVAQCHFFLYQIFVTDGALVALSAHNACSNI
jgi:hypothetical protein